MLGDLLLSTPDSVQKRVDIPAVEDINILMEEHHTWSIAGLTQKINILSDRLTVAFAGDCDQARNALEILGQIADLPDLNMELIIKVLNAIQIQDRNELAIIGILTTPDPNNKYGAVIEYFSVNVEPFFSEQFGKVYIAGSGEDGCVRVLKQFENYLDQNESFDDPYFFADLAALSIITQFVGLEFNTGANLLQLWGGGFEVASFQNGKIQKIGNILNIFWKLIKDKDSYILRLLPNFIKNDYWEDALLTRILKCSINQSGKFVRDRNALNISLPLMKRAKDYNFDELPSLSFQHTTLCCYVLFEQENGEIDALSTVRHDSSGVGWFHINMHTEYLHLAIKDDLINEVKNQIKMRFDIDAEFNQVGY